MAREQTKHSPVRGAGEIEQHPGDGGIVARLVVARLGQIAGDPEQTLRREIERRGQDLGHLHAGRFDVESQSFRQKRELATGGEGGAGQDDRFDAIEQRAFQNRGEVERDRCQGQSRVSPAPPFHPADRGAAIRRRCGGRPQCGGETLRRRVERQAVGDRLHAVTLLIERHEQVVERHAEPLGPNGIRPEVVGEAHHQVVGEATLQDGEQLFARAPRAAQRVEQPAGDQIAARRRKQVVARPQLGGERGEQTAPVPLQASE